MARSRAQEATITKDVAEPTAEREPDTPTQTAEQPTQIEPATQATPEQTVEQPAHIEPAPATRASTTRRAASARPSASRRNTAPGPDPEPTVRQSAARSNRRSNASQGSESEIDEVLKARRGRQFDWQRADRRGPQRRRQRTGREVQAIERPRRATTPRGSQRGDDHQGDRPADRRPRGRAWSATPKLSANTSDTSTRSSSSNDSDYWIEEQRHIDRERGRRPRPRASEPRRGRPPATPTSNRPSRKPATASKTWEPEPSHSTSQPTSSPLNPRSSKQGTMAATPTSSKQSRKQRERQESWERGIDPDRDNDRGVGIE